MIKLRSGEYTSLNLHLDVEQTLKLRGSIIRHTAEMFEPDLFIVDKEPMGLRGEVLETLEMLKPRGTRLVLGLRDVLDEPRLLEPEWQRKNVLPALRDLYDEIWVYGLPQICDPMEGIAADQLRKKMIYRDIAPRVPSTAQAALPEITTGLHGVTTGGGGEGRRSSKGAARLQSDPLLYPPGAAGLGRQQPERPAEFMDARRAEASTRSTFPALEAWCALRGRGAMGGYNRRRSVSMTSARSFVPRTEARLSSTSAFARGKAGLISMLADEGARPAVMAAALRRMRARTGPGRGARLAGP